MLDPLQVSKDGKFACFPHIRHGNDTFPPHPLLINNPGKQFSKIKTFDSRKDDVILCSSPKSGTHWVHEIISMFLTQSTEYNTKGNLLDYALEYMGDSEDMDKLEGQRLFQTHLPISFFPRKHVENRYRIVYLNRNPKDKYVSLYMFFRGKINAPVNWTWDEYFNDVVLKDTLFTGWFNFTKEMTDAVTENKANIFPLTYEDLLLDGRTQIMNLAKFLGVPFDDDFVDAIIEKCSFKNLSKHKIDSSTEIDAEGRSTLFRKGVIGDWKNFFTVSQNKQFDEMYKRELKGYDLNFIYE